MARNLMMHTCPLRSCRPEVGPPDEMRHFGTLLQLKESYVKGAGDDQMKADSGE